MSGAMIWLMNMLYYIYIYIYLLISLHLYYTLNNNDLLIQFCVLFSSTAMIHGVNGDQAYRYSTSQFAKAPKTATVPLQG